MLDREKIKKGLECCSSMDGNACKECPYSSECVTDEVPYQTGTAHLAADTLALLKEQEAKKVESIRFSRIFFAELTGYCPLCYRPLREQFNKCFCGNCGQAVKWK